MFKKIAIVVVVLIVAGLAFVATRPADFRVERTAQIKAPGDVVFAVINDFHRWGEWSPFDNKDPSMKKTYEGPAAGVGSAYTWAGNSDVGEGRATIVESKPNELVAIKLEFVKPFAATSQATFNLAPSEAGTQVSWILEGKNGFVGKAMCIVMDMDAMVGKDFEQGLASLNIVAQAEAQKHEQALPL